MPQIKIRPSANPDKWPRNLDDMKADPSRIVTLADLARLGIVRSYDTAKRNLPPPLKLPAVPKCWEARTILRAMGVMEAPEPVVMAVDDLKAAA